MSVVTEAASPLPLFSKVRLVRYIRQWGAAWALTALLAFLVLYPLGALFLKSFQGKSGNFTFANYIDIFSEAATWRQIWATLWLGAVRAAIATFIGIFLAWVITRTDTPGRKAISFFVWIGCFAPLLPILIAWVLLAGRMGIFNTLLQQLPFVHGPIFDMYSYAGIIWASSLSLGALVYILIEPAFRAMDSSMEESSSMCGASRLRTLIFITIPAVSPAILGALLYSFVLSVESFEPELLYGTPARIYVMSTRIYMMTHDFPQDVPGAMTLSSLVLVTIALLLVIQNRMLRGRSFVTVSGKASSGRLIKLGRWRWVTFGVCVFYIVCATVLPVIVLVLGSFMRAWGFWSLENFTFDNWTGFFSDDRLVGSIINTITIGVLVGLAGTFICAMITYLTDRTRFSGGGILTFITWAPRSAPAVVVAVAFASAFISGVPIFVPILGTVWILAIVLTVNSIPVAARTVSGAMHQISRDLEHASFIAGSSVVGMMRNVLLPLIAPALMNSFVLLFLLAARNLTLVLFFYTPDSRVLSTVLWEAWSGSAPEQGLVAGVVMMGISFSVLIGSLVLLRLWRPAVT